MDSKLTVGRCSLLTAHCSLPGWCFAALWRQCFYGSLRYGMYAPLKEIVAPGVPKSEMNLGHKILAGGLAGTLAQAVANPCDLVKVPAARPL